MNLIQKAKVLLGLNKAVKDAQRILETQPHQPMKLKPGIKTSEFWITIAVGIGAVVMNALGQIDGTTATAAATIVGALYSVARGLTKKNAGE